MTCKDIPAHIKPENIIKVSARYGTHFPHLQERLVSLVFDTTIQDNEIIITKTRHKFILQQTNEYLKQARSSFHSGFSPDLIAVDLRNALNVLGQLTGEVTSQDILNDIFTHFCVGK